MGTSDGLVVIAQWQSNSRLKLGLIPSSCTCTYTHLLFSISVSNKRSHYRCLHELYGREF